MKPAVGVNNINTTLPDRRCDARIIATHDDHQHLSRVCGAIE